MVPAGSSPQHWDSSLANPQVQWLEGLTPNGTYVLAETPASGWSSVFEGCTVKVGAGTPTAIGTASADGLGVTLTDVPPGGAVTCSFTNTQDPRIIVEKLLDSVPTAGWDYQLTIAPVQSGTQPVFIATNSTNANVTTGANGRAGESISPLPAADPRVVVTIRETTKPGVTLLGIACTATIEGSTTSRATSAVDLTTASTSVEVRAGEEVLCTFDNGTVRVGGITASRVNVGGISASTLPFTGPPGAAALKTGAWLLGIGAVLTLTSRRRRLAR